MNVHVPGPLESTMLASRKRLDAKFRGHLSAHARPVIQAKPVDPNAIRCPWPCFADETEYGAKEMSLSKIVNLVSIFYGVSEIDIKSARRTAKVMEPRMVCYYLAKELTHHSYPSIGRAFGDRDHTTILSGYRAITKRMTLDPALAKSIRSIRARLEGGN